MFEQLCITAKDFDKNFVKYMEKNKISDQSLKDYECLVLKKVISQLDMRDMDDARLLVYIMWKQKANIIRLLQSSQLKTNLEHIQGLFEKQEANFHQLIPYYDYVKFIGQYTDSVFVRDKCLDILRYLAQNWCFVNYCHSLTIFHPSYVMHLISFNPYISPEPSSNCNDFCGM